LDRQIGVSRPQPRVVVSGGAGFIGIHTVRRLAAEGQAVLVIDDLRHACGEPLPGEVDQEALDLTTPAAAAAVVRFRPDVIVHLAAQGGVSRSLRDPAGDAVVNVVGTVALLKAATDSRCPRFVFASSGGAIYGHARRLPTAESATPRPLSPYGAAKLAAEAYLGMFQRTMHISTIALRYSNVYGPFQDGTGEAGVVAITATRLIAGLPPEIRGDGQQTRDFVFVEDVADANLRAMSSTAQGVLNIGTGIATSVRRVADELMKAAGHHGEMQFVPAREGEVRHTALDTRRAAARLGWRASTDLRNGLERTLTSFRQRLVPLPEAASDARA
jgi:UDP-glucose 4-epimerase